MINHSSPYVYIFWKHHLSWHKSEASWQDGAIRLGLMIKDPERNVLYSLVNSLSLPQWDLSRHKICLGNGVKRDNALVIFQKKTCSCEMWPRSVTAQDLFLTYVTCTPLGLFCDWSLGDFFLKKAVILLLRHLILRQYDCGRENKLRRWNTHFL